MGNRYLEETKKFFKEVNFVADEESYATKGFHLWNTEKRRGEKAVLIIGLNPAGGKGAAKNENRDDFIYFNWGKDLDPLKKLKVDSNDKNSSGKYLHASYFSPIGHFVESVLEEDTKWDWANTNEVMFDKLIKSNDVAAIAA